eukprot:2064357-Heterocapsa_arctica.AAC.1
MDELDRIQIERIHARRYGIPWDVSQDCKYVKRQCPLLPEYKYLDRSLGLVTWSLYFSAANGLPSPLPHSAMTNDKRRYIANSPKHQAWTVYCQVLKRKMDTRNENYQRT